MLRFGDGRGNSGNDNNQCADAAYDGWNADKRENSRHTASVNSVLNGFVQSVPCCRKTADHKAENQQEQASASPLPDVCTIDNRIAHKAQQSKEHHRCNSVDRVPKIKFHNDSTFPLVPNRSHGLQLGFPVHWGQ